MENKSIVIIGVYFGKLPEGFPLWLKSTEYNPTIHWLIFSDQAVPSSGNVKFVKMTLPDFNALATKTMSLPIKIEYPYKLCDFKPVYGTIFAEFIRNYDFWGHCDFDLIWGDIRHFLTNELLEKYEKILYLGHLSLYRNNQRCNNLWRHERDGVHPADVFCSSQHFAFDEIGGIYQICKQHNVSVYEKVIYADISSIYNNRFQCAVTIEKHLGMKPITNYNQQIFFFENGKVVRAYYKDNSLETSEFLYIHFKKRTLSFDAKNFSFDSFYICPQGFVSKRYSQVNRDIIDKLNPYDELGEKRERIIDGAKLFYQGMGRRIASLLEEARLR